MGARYAFVLPRFGEEIVGGAETLVGQLASKLHQRGDHVEVFTTCAKDNRTWENFFPAGDAKAFGITVKRFPVDPRDLEVWIPRQISLGEGIRLGIDDEILWMKESVNSTALYGHLAKVAPLFDAVFFAPYLFATSVWGPLVYPNNAVLIPCLHDEAAAYTEIMQVVFRSVAGCVFNAAPEGELARAIFGPLRGSFVGMGFETPPALPPAKPLVEGRYVLYVGRKETGKNVQTLIDYFCEAKERKLLPSDLKLVVAGGGSFSDLHRPSVLQRNDVVDLSHLSEEEKARLIEGALVLCQPSTNESFSIVIMEAWLRNVPVLVHAGCAVTRDHVLSSGGGLYFGDAEEFSGAINLLLENPELATKLGEAGKRYVEEQYSWDAVLARFDKVVDEIFRGEKTEAAPL